MLTNSVHKYDSIWDERTIRKYLVKIWFLWWILSNLWIHILIIYIISNTYEFLLAIWTSQQYDSDANNIFSWYSHSIRWISLKIIIRKYSSIFLYFTFPIHALTWLAGQHKGINARKPAIKQKQHSVPKI